jgi:hypothetical protein
MDIKIELIDSNGELLKEETIKEWDLKREHYRGVCKAFCPYCYQEAVEYTTNKNQERH